MTLENENFDLPGKCNNFKAPYNIASKQITENSTIIM